MDEKEIKEAEILKEEIGNSQEEIFVEKEQSVEEMLIESIDEKNKKIKNLLSVIILTVGLFLGSLFVDIVQLVRGNGFSGRALKDVEVLQAAGKTWVAFAEPIVSVKVLGDESCGEACKPDEILLGLKSALPTMLTEKIEVNSPEGQKMIADFGLKTVPAFVFSKEIEKTELFAKAQPFLEKQGDFYAIKSLEAGFPVGKYLIAPTIAENDIKIGAENASVKIVAFSFLQNPADKKFYQEIITPMLKEYGDQIQFVFKNYFPASSQSAKLVALASECANAQGKFLPFVDKIFATQEAWSKSKDATWLFKSYASALKLNATDFAKCLDSKQFQGKLDASIKDGQSFGIQMTPAMFVGSDLQTSTAKYSDVKQVIDKALGK